MKTLWFEFVSKVFEECWVSEILGDSRECWENDMTCPKPDTKLELGKCSPLHLINVFFFIYLLESYNKITSLYLSRLQLTVGSVALVEYYDDHCFSWKNNQIGTTQIVSICGSQLGYQTRHIHAKIEKLVLDKFMPYCEPHFWLISSTIGLE